MQLFLCEVQQMAAVPLHDRQIGLRLVDVDRAALQALRAEIAKLPSAV